MSVMMTCIKHALEIEAPRPNPIVCGHCQRELMLADYAKEKERGDRWERLAKATAAHAESETDCRDNENGSVLARRYADQAWLKTKAELEAAEQAIIQAGEKL